jgi:HAE1 family hydrophobic/amphiphilic exporter-1
MPKDASLEQTTLHKKSRSLFRQRRFVHSQFTIVGQTSGGMGASQSTAYKSEINVKMVELDQRDEPANVYAAKPNVN